MYLLHKTQPQFTVPKQNLPLLFYTQGEIHADPNRTLYGPSVGFISTNISPPEHLSWPGDLFKMLGPSASVPPVNVFNLHPRRLSTVNSRDNNVGFELETSSSPSRLRTRGHSSKRPPLLSRSFAYGFRLLLDTARP